jgi:hypothetical protein
MLITFRIDAAELARQSASAESYSSESSVLPFLCKLMHEMVILLKKSIGSQGLEEASLANKTEKHTSPELMAKMGITTVLCLGLKIFSSVSDKNELQWMKQ